MYVIFLNEVAQGAVLNKIIYSWGKMNQMKEVLGEVR